MALNVHLESRLREVAHRQARLRLLLRLASCWAGAAFVGLLLVLLQQRTGWASWWPIPAIALGAVAACFLAVGKLRSRPDLRQVAREIESRHPELNGLLMTAAQQDNKDGKPLTYLQQRLVRDAIFHGAFRRWADAVPSSSLAIAQTANLLAVVFLGLVLWELRPTESGHIAARPRASNLFSVEITPGDAASR